MCLERNFATRLLQLACVYHALPSYSARKVNTFLSYMQINRTRMCNFRKKDVDLAIEGVWML